MNRLYIDRLRGRLYLLQVYDISKPEIKFKLIYMLIYLFILFESIKIKRSD